MFILRDPSQSLQWPVQVSIPQDGGGIRRYQFTGHFKVLLQAELEQVVEDDERFIAAMLVGWGDDLCDENQAPIPYSDVVREKLAAISYIKHAIITAYWQLSAGRTAKN